MSTPPPNIVQILADNLGWGERGCDGGGALRGAPTPRMDALAKEGLLLQNFNVESDCVPTRAALMTGRHPIRTGCLQSTPPGLSQGLHRSERTLAQLLGYDASVAGIAHIMQGTHGTASENVKVYDLDTRRGIDAELVDRSPGGPGSCGDHGAGRGDPRPRSTLTLARAPRMIGRATTAEASSACRT